MDSTNQKPQRGPWTISKDDGTAAEGARPGVIIGTESEHIAFCFDDDPAAAALIAAAPEMFNLLEILEDFLRPRSAMADLRSGSDANAVYRDIRGLLKRVRDAGEA